MRGFLKFGRFLKLGTGTIAVLLAGPIWMMAAGGVLGADWRTASRQPAGIAPDPAAVRESVVQVYGARAFGWRGAFGVHSWIATKRQGADSYRIYQVIGWRAYRGGNAVAVSEGVPDRYWFGSPPQLYADLRGQEVEAVIDRIEDAVRSYPYAHAYTLWPGPNSNTFVSWVARQVPELKLDLPPTAIGKDYLGLTRIADWATSGTGIQVSLFGLLGVTAAIEEGLEVNVAGLTFGIDPKDLNLKLPGIGRLGPAPDPRRDAAVAR